MVIGTIIHSYFVYRFQSPSVSSLWRTFKKSHNQWRWCRPLNSSGQRKLWRKQNLLVLHPRVRAYYKHPCDFVLLCHLVVTYICVLSLKFWNLTAAYFFGFFRAICFNQSIRSIVNQRWHSCWRKSTEAGMLYFNCQYVFLARSAYA